MAKTQEEIDREIEIFEYEIAEANRLSKEWEKYDISQEKINKILEKKAKFDDELKKIKPQI